MYAWLIVIASNDTSDIADNNDIDDNSDTKYNTDVDDDGDNDNDYDVDDDDDDDDCGGVGEDNNDDSDFCDHWEENNKIKNKYMTIKIWQQCIKY